jgi:hypothetical protein
VLSAVATSFVATVRADTVVIPADRDNTLFQSASGSISNGAGPAMFAGANSAANIRRALMRFDVASYVPANATILSVELRLHVSNAPDSIPRTIDVCRLLADWGEGGSYATGGGGAPAQPGDATWLHRFYSDQLWASAGGDFDPSPHATAVVGDPDDYVWTSAALTADVEAWLANPAEDFGWMLRGEEDVPSTARRIDTRENEDEAVQPALVVEYQVDTLSIDEATGGWARTKAAFRR